MAKQCFLYSTPQNVTRGIPKGFGVLPCPNGFGCCPDDSVCTPEGICVKLKGNPIRPGSSQFSMGSCTDPNYPFDKCPPIACASFQHRDVIFDQEKRIWFCCGVDPVTKDSKCNNHSQEWFKAPAPADLQSLGVAFSGNNHNNKNNINGNMSPSYSSAIQQANASGLMDSQGISPTTSTRSFSHYYLSPGTVAAIAAGVSVSSILTIAVIAYLFLRYRRGSRCYKTKDNIVRQESGVHDSKPFATKFFSCPDFEDKDVDSALSRQHTVSSQQSMVDSQQHAPIGQTKILNSQQHVVNNERYKVNSTSNERHEIGGPNDLRHEADSSSPQKHKADSSITSLYKSEGRVRETQISYELESN